MPTWYADLTASVHALGAAADELRIAHITAVHAARTVDSARIVPLPGLLAVPDTEPVRPYDEALFQLAYLYQTAEQRTWKLYESAALGYALGAAQAVAAVLRAEHPHHVTLARDLAGYYLLGADALPDFGGSLTAAAGAHDLAELRARVLTATKAELADATQAYGERAELTLAHLIRFAADHGFLHER